MGAHAFECLRWTVHGRGTLMGLWVGVVREELQLKGQKGD